MGEGNLKQKLSEDLKQAMRGGDTVKRNTLRMLLSAMNNAEIARQTKLEDGDIIGVIAKEVKQHHESIEAFKQGNRPDLVEKEEAELTVLQGYLPQQMGREEVIEAARKVIAEVGAEGPRDKGKVMSKLMAQLKGRADGREINEIVSQLLSS